MAAASPVTIPEFFAIGDSNPVFFSFLKWRIQMFYICVNVASYWQSNLYFRGGARYNYSKEDEEMFKEFYEIANVFIPNILKQSSPGKDGKEVYKPSEDPQFFSYLLQFYDGICLWEEGSHTPVLHADWAKKLVQSISKISPACRASLAPTPKLEPRPPVPQAPPALPEVKPDTGSQVAGNLQNNSTPNSEQALGTSHQAPTTGEANNVSGAASSANDKEAAPSKPAAVLSLKSTKMKEMRRLLTNGGKLNTSAIKLQLTAQSQVSVPKNRRRSSFKADDYVYDFDEEADKEEEEEEEEEVEEEEEEEEWEEEEEEYPWAKRPRQGMYPMF